MGPCLSLAQLELRGALKISLKHCINECCTQLPNVPTPRGQLSWPLAPLEIKFQILLEFWGVVTDYRPLWSKTTLMKLLLLICFWQILRHMKISQSECTKPSISMCSGGDLLINLTDPTPCGDGELQLAGNSINWIQLRLGQWTNWICPSVRRLQSSERLEDPGCDDKMTGWQNEKMTRWWGETRLQNCSLVG